MQRSDRGSRVRHKSSGSRSWCSSSSEDPIERARERALEDDLEHGVSVVPVASTNLGIVKKRFSSFIRKRFVGYSIVGAFVLALGLATLTTLVEVGHVNQIIAGLCSTVVSVEVNFFLNWRINWRDRKTKLIRAWPAFHATRVFALTANQILYTVLVAGGTYYLAATGVTTTLSIFWNYYLNDKVAFRQQRET